MGGGKPDVIAHAYDKICKATLTIADLATNENIQPEHTAQAISHKKVVRENCSHFIHLQ